MARTTRIVKPKYPRYPKPVTDTHFCLWCQQSCYNKRNLESHVLMRHIETGVWGPYKQETESREGFNPPISYPRLT